MAKQLQISALLVFCVAASAVFCSDSSASPAASAASGLNLDEVPLANLSENVAGATDAAINQAAESVAPIRTSTKIRKDLKGLYHGARSGMGKAYEETRPALSNLGQDLRGGLEQIKANPRVAKTIDYAKPKVARTVEFAKPKVEYVKTKAVPIYAHGKQKLSGLLHKTANSISSLNTPVSPQTAPVVPVAPAGAQVVQPEVAPAAAA